MFPLHKNINIFFNYILSPLLGAWLFYSLYRQVKGQPHLYDSIDMIKQSSVGDEAWKFWTVMVLVFINWGIEARKWQLLVRSLQPINLFVAFKSVLAGVTLSINTPNRMGEYAARILFVKEGNRIKAISLSIVGSMSQLIITLLMGCGGLIYIIVTKQASVNSVMGLSFFWIKTLLFLAALAAGILMLLYFKLSWMVKIIEKIPPFLKYAHYISVLEEFHAKVLLRLLSLSLVRYLVFVIQYILLLQVLSVEISWIQGFWIISILFLVLAIIPSFAIADLGIRGKFSTELLTLYSANTIGIIGTTFGIWFINLFIPALAGSILILGIKIFKEK
ncbi:MAG: flippase-like domain-containing protein [Chitinophagaceae bacterium]|nr:flippase-like domain-containing protein [Chitinophagaceae bacterium]